MKREKTYLFVLLFGAITNIAFSLLFGMLVWKDKPAFGVALTPALLLINVIVFKFPIATGLDVATI